VGAEDLFHRPELQSCIVAPSGQVVAQAFTAGDEVIVTWDLDWCQRYATTIFDFDRYRRPEIYKRITASAGRTTPAISRTVGDGASHQPPMDSIPVAQATWLGPEPEPKPLRSVYPPPTGRIRPGPV
jgi:hypothetical protein